MSGLFHDLDTESPNWNALHDSAWTETDMLVFGLTSRDVSKRAKGRLVYLASPYSKLAVDHHGKFCDRRSKQAADDAARWQSIFAFEGLTSISPIMVSVNICDMDVTDAYFDPLDENYWENWCRPLLAQSEVLVIPPIKGWDESIGVWREAVYFIKRCRPVFLMQGVS